MWMSGRGRIKNYLNHFKLIIFNFSGKRCKLKLHLGSEKNCKIIFEDGNNSEIHRLSLLSGSMENFPDFTQAIQKFKNNRYLDAGFTGLKYVERQKLAIFKDIIWISFFGNQIQDFESDTFADLTKLQKILIANNKLKNLHRDLFVNNVNLEEVWLQGNELEVLPEGLFRNNFELKTIFAGENKLKKIKIDFLDLPRFKNIDLRHNECIDEWCGEDGYCGTGSKLKMQQKILSIC